MDLSFWEKNTYFNHPDIVIVGSGIVGLNAARALKELKPRWKILVVDRGFLPYGASTRNAGFACFGSLSELLDDLTKMSEADVFSLVQRRWDGLNRLRSIIGDEALHYEPLGGYEVFDNADDLLYTSCAEKINWFNEKLFTISGKKDIYSLQDDKIKSFGFKNINHLILNNGEGQVDTGMMMQALLHHVRNLGIDVINGINLRGWEQTSTGMKLETDQGFNFTADRILITTNAFAKQLIPELEVTPGRAQVLITAPIEGLKVKGCFHYDRGYYYFRNVGERILLGGGRNMDFVGEETMEFGLTELIQNKLETLLNTLILPNTKVDIEQRWSGIMGLGSVKTTIVRQVDKNLFCGVRMGGMGIAIGTLVGEEAAKMIVEAN